MDSVYCLTMTQHISPPSHYPIFSYTRKSLLTSIDHWSVDIPWQRQLLWPLGRRQRLKMVLYVLFHPTSFVVQLVWHSDVRSRHLWIQWQ